MTLIRPMRAGVADRRYRPPVGIPKSGDRHRLQGLLGSIAVHLLFALVFLVPWVVGEVLAVREHRAGGGPAGGGGGGRGGSGGTMIERLFYVPLISPAPAPEQPAVQPETPQLRVPPPPPERPPEVRPPEVRPPEQPQPAPSTPPVPDEVSAAAPSSPATSVVPGEGGGSGRDGSAGSGPGSGGGVGSGIGTGRGSGVGPGTGTGAEGDDTIYPPTLVTLALPPLQAPARLRPFHLVALFDVDERGNTRLIRFNETPDAGFNRRVRQVLAEVRFRPAVRADGRAVRDTGRFEIEYP